jgi:hypothetical protein
MSAKETAAVVVRAVVQAAAVPVVVLEVPPEAVPVNGCPTMADESSIKRAELYEGKAAEARAKADSMKDLEARRTICWLRRCGTQWQKTPKASGRCRSVISSAKSSGASHVFTSQCRATTLVAVGSCVAAL